MKEKKFIKLINNEKINCKASSEKACDATSTDICDIDYEGCTVYSYDVCVKLDKSACSDETYDRCDKDYAGCYEPNYDSCGIDNCEEDSCNIDLG